MTYDYELILITPGSVVEDELGNQIVTDPLETPIYCGVKSIGRTEFYNAAVTNLRPEIIFVVHAFEYDGQKTVKYDGVIYRVMRTYQTGTEEIELTCEKVTADG